MADTDTTPTNAAERAATDTDATDHASSTGEESDVRMAWPTPSPRRGRVVAAVLAFIVLIGVGGWQIVDLHHQVHHLQQTTKAENQQLARAQQELSTLRSSVSAAIGCLATPQVQPAICTHFLR